ncbi:hypothetical protein [Kitasatospora sp. LaBMicrA B282]|uniref:hypothetical protein n=1 Tax=Kitasatospora sp. LaBMicrA B282 TaxID=3420949 RepID=UPI003D0DC3E4
MFRSTKTPVEPVLVIRESPELAVALRQALEGAGDGERAGLARALTLVEDAAARPDREVRRRWVHRILAAGGHAVHDDVAAVKALRQAAPSLTLTAAYQLVREATEE